MILLHVRPELVFLTSIELVENQLGWASYPHSKNQRRFERKHWKGSQKRCL